MIEAAFQDRFPYLVNVQSPVTITCRATVFQRTPGARGKPDRSAQPTLEDPIKVKNPTGVGRQLFRKRIVGGYDRPSPVFRQSRFMQDVDKGEAREQRVRCRFHDEGSYATAGATW